jgi:hypothetical protein
MPTLLPKVSLTTGKVTWSDGAPVQGADVTGFIVGLRSLTVPGSAPGTYPILSPIVPASATSDALSAVTASLKPDDYAVAVQAQSANGPSVWSVEVAFTGELPRPNSPTDVSVG